MPHPRRYLPWVLPSLIALIAPAAWIARCQFPTGLHTSHDERHDGIIDLRLHRYSCNYGAIAIEYAHFRNPDIPRFREATAKYYPRGTSLQPEKWIYPRNHFLGFYFSWFPNPGRSIFSLFI